LTLFYNPLGWFLLLLLIPGIASIIIGAAIVGVGNGSAADSAVGLDSGGPAGGAGW